MIKIFITNLGKYNEGELVGEWVDLPIYDDDLNEVLERIGIGEEYEEYFITDYETNVEGLKIEEYSNIDELNDMAEAIEELESYQITALEALLENGDDFDNAIRHVDDCIVYHNCTMEDIAREYIDEIGALSSMPEELRWYFDYEKLAKDMEIKGTYISIGEDIVEIRY